MILLLIILLICFNIIRYAELLTLTGIDNIKEYINYDKKSTVMINIILVIISVIGYCLIKFING